MELRFSVAPKLKEDFPSCYTAVFGPANVNVGVHTLERILQERSSELENLRHAEISSLESVQSWRGIFSKIGASSSFKSSIESLLEYFQSSGGVPAKLPLVGFYNLASLLNMTPMAAYDMRFIEGPMQLRYAKKGEAFVPLGLPKQVEKTKNGEVVYADSQKIICRCWNKQDCDQTKLREDTRNAVFFADIVSSDGEAVSALMERIRAFLDVGVEGALRAELL